MRLIDWLLRTVAVVLFATTVLIHL